MTIPTRITDEARKLARAALLYGGLDWATDSIAKALNTERLAAEQRGREMEREEQRDLHDKADAELLKAMLGKTAIRSRTTEG